MAGSSTLIPPRWSALFCAHRARVGGSCWGETHKPTQAVLEGWGFASQGIPLSWTLELQSSPAASCFPTSLTPQYWQSSCSWHGTQFCSARECSTNGTVKTLILRWGEMKSTWLKVRSLAAAPSCSLNTPPALRRPGTYRTEQCPQQLTLASLNGDTAFHLHFKKSGWNSRYCVYQDWVVFIEVVYYPLGASLICRSPQSTGPNWSPM